MPPTREARREPSAPSLHSRPEHSRPDYKSWWAYIDSGEEDLHVLDDQNREDHAGDSRMNLTDIGNHLWFDDLNEAQLIQRKWSDPNIRAATIHFCIRYTKRSIPGVDARNTSGVAAFIPAGTMDSGWTTRNRKDLEEDNITQRYILVIIPFPYIFSLLATVLMVM